MYQVKNDAHPEAFITRKKSRVKIYQFNNLYFNDGEIFEIELFNPKTNRVLSKIWLNGEEITGSGIIINPGQRIFLERFVDSNNKFIYKTYEVENTNISLNAIRNNGDIEIKFFDEYFQTIVAPLNQYWYGNKTTLYSYGSSGSYFTDNNFTYGGGSPTLTVNNTAGSFETGRIEKGESTDQSFSSTSGSFNYLPTKSVKYKILPVSSKPIEGKDLKKYCTECGQSIKKEWKFCPNCGAKL
jgi:hypothetical protein